VRLGMVVVGRPLPEAGDVLDELDPEHADLLA
jgi:hypothetical protein